MERYKEIRKYGEGSSSCPRLYSVMIEVLRIGRPDSWKTSFSYRTEFLWILIEYIRSQSLAVRYDAQELP